MPSRIDEAFEPQSTLDPDEAPIGLDDDELSEFDRTFGDQLWRLQNLYKVHVKPTRADPRGGIRPFTMWPPQRSMFDNRWYRNVVLKCRQLGSTTFWCMFLLDACLFGDEPVRCGIVSYTKEAARELLDKCRLAFEEMDPAVKQAFGLTMKSTMDKLTFGRSHIRCGVSMRGGTVDLLLVSELGKLAARFPAKAKEVVTGCFPTVPAENGMIIVESTAEGHGGQMFDLVAEAAEIRDDPARAVGQEDFHLHFFAWHQQQEYRSDEPYEINEALNLYFDRLRMRGILLDKQQKWWYARQKAKYGDEIYREFPSYQAEAFMATSNALILAKVMIDAEENGQVGDLRHNPELPVVCSWDLGQHSAVWLYQYMPKAPAHRCYIDYLEGQHADFTLWKKELDRLAAQRGYRYGAHVFPSDGEHVQAMTNHMVAFAQDAGFENINVIPLQPFDLQQRYAAMMMPMSWFDLERTMLGRQRVSSYRRVFDQSIGDFVDKPKKDTASHGAEAWLLSLFYDPVDLTMPKPPSAPKRSAPTAKAKTGVLGRLFGKKKRPVSVASADGALVIGNSLLRRLLGKV